MAWDKFEILIHDSSDQTPAGDNSLITQYQTANGYTSNTVGLQDPSKSIGIQCLLDGAYHRAASPIVPGRAIRYTTAVPSSSLADAGHVPPRTRLGLRAFPNPLRDAARISLSLPVSGHVRLTVLNVAGRRVCDLLDADVKRGSYFLNWNRRDSRGRRVPAGVYLYRLETASGALNFKTVVVN